MKQEIQERTKLKEKKKANNGLKRVSTLNKSELPLNKFQFRRVEVSLYEEGSRRFNTNESIVGKNISKKNELFLERVKLFFDKK